MRWPLLGLVAGALAMATMLPPVGAHSQSAGETNTCNGESDAPLDVQIRDCTALIRSHSESPRNRATDYNNRGEAWRAKGDNDRAIADYSEAIRLDPKFAVAYNNRGLAWHDKHDHDRAIADFSEAILLDPKFAVTYHNRGDAWRTKGDNDRAIADFNEAIRLDRKYALAFYHRGLAWRAKGDNERAMADHNEATRLDPKFGAADAPRSLSRSEAGGAAAGAAAGVDPKFAAAYTNRGNLWFSKNNYDLAIADYNEAIKLDPKYALAYYNRALTWGGKGDYDRAIADYSEAIRLDPSDALAYANRGDAWRNKGDRDRAIADYSDAIRLDSKDALAYANRGNAWNDKGDHDRAVADLNEAILLTPKVAWYWNFRCWARATGGRELPLALADCTESLRLKPGDAHTMDSRGFVYLRMGRLDEAIAEYSAAVKIDPKIAGSLYGRGIARLKKGDAGGNADLAAAKAVEGDIAAQFMKYGIKPEGATRPATVATSGAAAPDCAGAEAHWRSAETLGILAGYEDHLVKFSKCAFAATAKVKIEALKRPKK